MCYQLQMLLNTTDSEPLTYYEWAVAGEVAQLQKIQRGVLDQLSN